MTQPTPGSEAAPRSSRRGSIVSRLRALTDSWFARDILLPFLTTRAMLIAVSWLGLLAFQGIGPGPGNWELKPKGQIGPIGEVISPWSHPFLNVWLRWDAGWYQSLA